MKMYKPRAFLELRVLGSLVTMPELQQTLEHYAENGFAICADHVVEIIRTASLVLDQAATETLLASARKGALKLSQAGVPLLQDEYDRLVHFLDDDLQAENLLRRIAAEVAV